jgi:hypothetical protein
MSVNVELGKKYQDSMDPSRILVPVKVDGKTVHCKVLWKTTKGDKTTAGGSTRVSINLFGGSRSYEDINFRLLDGAGDAGRTR